MRRDYDGYNDEALTDPATDARELITGADFNGDLSTFWLRYLIVRNSHATDDAVLNVYDQDEGAAVGVNLRFTLDVPASTTVLVELPGPGVSFLTNITGSIVGPTGTIAVGNVHAGGYITGGMEG